MLQGIIFTCLICSPGKCGSFFGSTAAVEDEYSRAVLGRQSGKGSKQSVPYPSLSGGSGILFILVFVGKNKDKGNDREDA